MEGTESVAGSGEALLMAARQGRGEVRSIREGAESLMVPPYSLPAEMAVLGSVMISPTCWDALDGALEAEDFYRQDHQIIWREMGKLADAQKPLDAITVSDALEAASLLDQCGGMAYLLTLAKDTPSAVNAKSYAEIVREKADFRQLIASGVAMSDRAYRPNGAAVEDLIAEAERAIYALAQRRERSKGGPEQIDDAMKKAVDNTESAYLRRLSGEVAGLSTGFAALDAETEGLHPGDMVIVAGRPSMGKTSLAMQIAEHVGVRAGKTVAVFSLEMPSDQLSQRMLSSVGRIPLNRLRSGAMEDDDWPRLVSATAQIAQKAIYIDDAPAPTVGEIRSRCRRLARTAGGLHLVVVDYLQLIDAKLREGTRNDEISAVSRGLKALAKELNVPVIALSQLNRSLEQRTDKRPIMSDLRDSGAIEQDADVILFLYRDEVYSKGRCKDEDKGVAEVIIGKQRNGPIGTVRLRFEGEYTRFEDWLPPGPGDYAGGGY
jgi:replicative DNA helicase